MSRIRFYLCALLAAGPLVCFVSNEVHAQQTDTSAPVIVQTGRAGTANQDAAGIDDRAIAARVSKRY
jgi:hypothetical protein